MGKIRIDLDGSFTANKNYYVLADEGFAVDANTGEPSPAITDKNAVTFTAQPEFETIEYLPADNTVDFVGGLTSKSKRIDITFEQDVFKGDSGTINLFSDSTLIESFDILTDVYFRFSPPGSENTTGKTITIYASDWFENTSPTHVIISDGALRDAQCMTNREMDSRTNPNLSVTFNMQSAQPIPTMGDSRITLRYCEDIVKLSGNAYLYDSNDTLIETMDVATQGGVSGDTLTLTPKYQLEETKEYYVTTDRGVIGDDHGFSFGPLVKGDTNVVQTFFRPYATFNIVLQFNRDVKSSADYPAEGKVYLKRQSDDKTVKTWDVKWNSDWIGSENPYYPNNYEPTGINISSEDIITYNDNRATLKAKMAQGGAYYLLIDSGAFKDLDRIPLDEIALASAWDFEVYDGPTVSSATFNAGGTATMTFNDTINIGNSDQIFLYRDSDDALIDTIQSPSQVTLLNNQVTFNTSVFDSVSKDYYILSDKEILTDDENYQFRGITDKTVATLSSLNSLVSSVPSDDQTEFKTPVSTGFSMTFDRDIQAGTGNISLYRTSDDALIEAFDVTSDVIFAGDTASWNSSAALDPLTQYYILVDASAINSTGGDSFEGISSKTAFNFETFSFALSTTSPGDNAVGVDFLSSVGFNLSFNDPIEAGTGNISLYRTSDDALIEAFDVTSDVSIVNDTVTCVVTEPVDEQTEYYVLVDGTAINSVGGLNYEGISSKTAFNFTIEAMTPTLSPLNGATVTGTEFTMTFAEDITELTGNISLYRTSDDALIETFDVANSSEVTVTSNEVFFERTENLSDNTGYYILVDDDTFVSTDNIEYNGITSNTAWSWTTQGPQVITTSITTDDMTTLDIVYDSNVFQGTAGAARIYKTSGDVLIETIPYTAFSITNDTVTLSPTETYNPESHYIEIDGTALVSNNKIYAEDLTGANTIDLTIDNSSYVSYTPTPNDNSVDDLTIEFTLQGNWDLNTGNVYLYRYSDDTLISTFDVVSDGTFVSGATSSLSIPSKEPTGSNSSQEQQFYILSDAGIAKRNNVYMPAVSNKTDWSFWVVPLSAQYGLPNDFDSTTVLLAAYNRTVYPSSSTIELYDGTTLLDTKTSPTDVYIENDEVLRISPFTSIAFETGKTYHIKMGAGTVIDGVALQSQSIVDDSTWAFTTATDVNISSVTYTPNSVFPGYGTLTLSTMATSLTKGTGDVRIYKSDTTLFETLDINDATISNGDIIFSDLSFNTGESYYVLVDASVVHQNSVYNAEVSNSTALTFSTPVFVTNGTIEAIPSTDPGTANLRFNGSALVNWGDGTFVEYPGTYGSNNDVSHSVTTGLPIDIILVEADTIQFITDSFSSVDFTDLSGITSFDSLFCGPLSNNYTGPHTKLTSFSAGDTSGITNFAYAWSGCNGLTSFPAIDTSSGTNFAGAWYACYGLTSFPLIDTSSGTNFEETWNACSGLTSFPAIDTSSGTNFAGAWSTCTGLTSFPLIDTSAGTNFSLSWRSCNFTSFPLIDTSAGTNFDRAWWNCDQLTSFPAINTSAGTNFTGAWKGCHGLTSFPAINTSAGANFEETWYECWGLTSFPAINTSAGTNFRYTWFDCHNLVCLNSVDTTGISTTYDSGGMFNYCTALTAPNASEQTQILNGYNYVNPNPCP